jgi:phage tail-like protein
MATAINNRSNQAIDPIRNFRFLVSFEQMTPGEAGVWRPNPQLGFTSVSGLAISTESIPYREGGYNTTVHQIPGQSTFSPVTFQRGVQIGSRQHWDWMEMLFQTVTGENMSQVSASFRSDVIIRVLNHPVPYANNALDLGTDNNETKQSDDDTVVAEFRLYNAWPTSIAYSDMNAGDNALMVEQMTLVHEGMTMKWATWNGETKTVGTIS